MLTRDIKNAYLCADCNINIYTWLGPEFVLARFMELKTISMAKVEKAFYSLSSSGQNQHFYLAGTLWNLGLKPARYDQDVFMHQNKVGSGYDYVSCHTNDLLIVVVNAQEVLDFLMKIYEVRNPGPPAHYLGCVITAKLLTRGGMLLHWQLHTC